jgi:hypothetical protein
LSLLVDAADGGASLHKRVMLWGSMILAMWAFLWFIMPEKSTGVAAAAESQALVAIAETTAALRTHFETNQSFPQSLDGLAETSFARIRDAAQQAQRESYRLEYMPGAQAAGGNIQTFSLQARPGRHGYRSFFANETSVVHWTREGRAATAQDPIL